MRMINFARRNFKELIRDPLSLVFEIALPIFLLFIFQQIKIPGDTYKLENFTPGIIIFGFSFITLFTSTLVAKDRGSSLLIRLGTSPMKSSDYILGYILSLIPIIIIQDSLFFIVACLLGLNISINIILTIIASIFVSILFIAFGILIGSLVSEKASGSKDLIGNGFAKLCELLPFESALNIIKGVLNNNYDILSTRNIILFVAYTIIILILSIIVFKRKMIGDNK